MVGLFYLDVGTIHHTNLTPMTSQHVCSGSMVTQSNKKNFKKKKKPPLNGLQFIFHIANCLILQLDFQI